jgi:hypothetical protein
LIFPHQLSERHVLLADLGDRGLDLLGGVDLEQLRSTFGDLRDGVPQHGDLPRPDLPHHQRGVLTALVRLVGELGKHRLPLTKTPRRSGQAQVSGDVMAA